MRVLVACEYSGIVRDAFLAMGHDAVSCDLLPTDSPGPHIMGDVRDILANGWDLMVCHPPCTHLSASGARWFRQKQQEQQDALAFIRTLLGAPIPKIALENPVGVISTQIRKPDQYIQPWQFGHGEVKKTGLWLRELPPLVPTNVVDGREPRILNRIHPGPNRGHERSRFFTGIAEAMAQQWGGSYCSPQLDLFDGCT